MNRLKSKFIFAFAIAFNQLLHAVKACPPLPFYKIAYGTGKHQVTTMTVDPLKTTANTEVVVVTGVDQFGGHNSHYVYAQNAVFDFDMRNQALDDCAGFWFLSQVTDLDALSVYDMGGRATGYWCSGSLANRRVFNGTSVTTHNGWQPTVRLVCDGHAWHAETGMLHGSSPVIDRIECNTMSQQLGPCTRTA